MSLVIVLRKVSSSSSLTFVDWINLLWFLWEHDAFCWHLVQEKKVVMYFFFSLEKTLDHHNGRIFERDLRGWIKVVNEIMQMLLFLSSRSCSTTKTSSWSALSFLFLCRNNVSLREMMLDLTFSHRNTWEDTMELQQVFLRSWLCPAEEKTWDDDVQQIMYSRSNLSEYLA